MARAFHLTPIILSSNTHFRMRNKLFLVAVILPFILGCGIGDRVQRAITEEPATNVNGTAANVNANKSLTDKAVDTAVGGQKIGIQECDEAMDILEAQANNPDDNFVTKAVKKTALNTFRDQLKQQVEQNPTNKGEVAKFCREFRNNLADSLNNSNSNSGGSY